MIDDRLSEDIEQGARFRTRFATTIVTTDGGWEIRNSRWSYPLHEFEFSAAPGNRGDVDIEAFRDLFYAAGGSFQTFKFKHRYDFTGTAEAIGTGTGASQNLQLIKNYSRGAITRSRKITRPVEDTVTIYYNGVAQVSGFTIDYDTGIVTCSPGAGVAVTADFEFDIAVRFEDDELEFLGLTDELSQPVSIVLLEVRE